MYRVTASGSQGLFVVEERLRAPHRAVREIFEDEGNVDDGDVGKITTAWEVARADAPALVLFVHDRQDEDDSSFSLSAFRARPAYDWRVAGPTKEALDRFCAWLADRVVEWAHRQPRARRLTAESKARINELVRAGRSPGDATRDAGVWEEVAPSVDEPVWPIRGAPRDY